MPTPTFVHLRLHSEYSIADGTIRVGDAVAAAADDGMPALALTDRANLFGLVKFYQAARAKGVKPIIGCDVHVTHAAERAEPWRMILLAMSHGGYLKLCDWLTRAYRRNQHRGRAEIDPAWFDEGTDGLIAHCRAGGRATSAMRCRGNADGASRRRRRGPRASRNATTSKSSARAMPTTTTSSPPPSRSPAAPRCPWLQRIRCSS